MRRKRNFRINVFLYVSAAVATTLLAICVYFDKESTYLLGTEITTSSATYQKYKTTTKLDKPIENGTIIPVTNYNEYKKVTKYYGIKTSTKLTKKDLKTNDYVYVIINESTCQDKTQFEKFIITGDKVTLNFITNNCTCYSSNTNTIVYEIKYPKKINDNNTFYVNFTEPLSSNRNTCQL